MASGTSNKGKKGSSAVKAARSSVVVRKGKPWGTILAVVAVLVVAGAVFGYAITKVNAAKEFTVSEDNQDPSENIPGVVKVSYAPGSHVQATQRVAYDQSPAFGGPHDATWADCQGTVYPNPVRTENMVHGLEHGAVWIAYNPDQVKGADLDLLRSKVENQSYMMMSPYPGLDKPISLQSWGHQLKLDSATDERVDQFIRSLRTNTYLTPEPGGSCDATGSTFNVANPPPFVAEKPGADAVPMDSTGTAGTPGDAGLTGTPMTTTGAAPSQ
ncbi:DUF3105 domain-containing protein [Actinokineospora bangkokensis]|uniref:DUF3105 domain-containing protein n=1 Tax=Actinokineospora bangkokensis TaxID=1193682 RepID=A0A1Q9LGV8_9PSEU|nr:DUF3105 domain-containing protein [Actinokineospora bangkokensis]OLR91250.1 hypothetical protein BJP25_26635 [Actinokineospora bangkokensis]